MHFLADIYIKCDDCNGKRFNRETLEILYRGKNISDILKIDGNNQNTSSSEIMDLEESILKNISNN